MSKKVKSDTISQLKKEEDKIKKEKKKEEEEDQSEEEEDEEKNQNVVKEQTIQKADKPKNLKELFGSMGDAKTKPKKKTQKTAKNKEYEEPAKHKFINSKGTGNADKIDNELKKNKKVFTNASGLDAAAKENQKIKHTKDYLEKDKQKEYNEDVEKPQFTSNIKEGNENFVELNQDEDVRNNFFILYFHVYSF